MSRVSDLDKYFNEAAINLVQLLIWFSAVQLAIDPAKKKLIVLDDFITSLDAANRAYMMRYVLKTFSEAQLIILTHDYSLFNITIFLIDHVLRTSNEWVQYKLYIIGTEHRLATAGKIEIKDLRYSLRHATNYDSIGNDVRKCFEQRLYDLAAELSIGRLETTKNIIDCLGQGKNVYFKPRTNLSELVEAIETLLPTITDVRTRAVFQAKINEYKVSVQDATLMKDTVNLLKFYQKITMHPMSHGTLGIPHFGRKDVEESIKLLEQLDKCVTSILDGKV